MSDIDIVSDIENMTGTVQVPGFSELLTLDNKCTKIDHYSEGIGREITEIFEK